MEKEEFNELASEHLVMSGFSNDADHIDCWEDGYLYAMDVICGILHGMDESIEEFKIKI